jgi:hypothetical protein
MTELQAGETPVWDRAAIKALIERFFEEGNDAMRFPAAVQPFIEALQHGTDAPIVLPRFVEAADHFAMYVIARNAAQVSRTRELIEAFAGGTYCKEGGATPARLDPADPVDAAVIDFAGPNNTFTLDAGLGGQKRANLRNAMRLMQAAVASGPRREWRVPQPLGRLLAEFGAAIAAGGEAASREVLEQIAERGGLSATNLTHLRIKRLDRLGLSGELLSLPGLDRVLLQDPPVPVKDAVLSAVHSAVLEDPLAKGDFSAAQDGLCDPELPTPLPLLEDVRLYSDEAVTVLITAAVGRGDAAAVARMMGDLAATGRQRVLPNALAEAVAHLLETRGSEASASGSPSTPLQPDPARETGAVITVAAPTPTSWSVLYEAVRGAGEGFRSVIREETWRDWPSPADIDEDLSAVATAFDDATWKRAWETLTGPLIEAMGYDQSAPRTVLAFLTYAFSFDRFGPGDLITVQALTEIYLRSAPGSAAYAELLDMVHGSCGQWVSPENAVVAMDFADRLVLAAAPDRTARTQLAVALLEPLNRYRERLDPQAFAFARQLAGELEIPFDWEVAEQPTEMAAGEAEPLTASILLYSLDQAVLQRTATQLQGNAPHLRVSLSDDKVGSDSLRQKARHADVVVLATRCATHAATGFITQNTRDAVISYADGSGSASLLRAASEGLNQWRHRGG